MWHRPPRTTRKGRTPLLENLHVRKASRCWSSSAPAAELPRDSWLSHAVEQNMAVGVWRVKTLFCLRRGLKTKVRWKLMGRRNDLHHVSEIRKSQRTRVHRMRVVQGECRPTRARGSDLLQHCGSAGASRPGFHRQPLPWGVQAFLRDTGGG